MVNERADRPVSHWFLERSTAQPSQTAFRYKHLGIWQEVTWGEYRERVEGLARGLLALGVQPGDRVGILAGPIPEWFISDLAIQSLGAISVGIYPATTPADLGALLRQAQARVFIAEDQDAVDDLRATGEPGTALETILVVKPHGARPAGPAQVLVWAAVEERGRQGRAASPEQWGELVRQRQPDEIIGLFPTAGTTGPPKAVPLSSRHLIQLWSAALPLARPLDSRDRTVTGLPLAAVEERVFSVLLPILTGSVAHLPENQDTVGDARLEVQPSLLVSVPRTWEIQAAQLLVDAETSDWLRRGAIKLALAANRRRPGGGGGPGWSLLGALADGLIGRPIRQKLGYGNLRLALVLGAPLAPEASRLWRLLGVPLHEAYGLTEAGGLASCQREPTSTPGTVGPPVPGVELQLAPDGEILLRGVGVFAGYPKAGGPLADPFDAAGWLRTGDFAEQLPNGEVRISDRRENLLQVRGQLVAAAAIEALLKVSPYIRAAVITDEDANHLIALLEVDFATLAEWARSRRITYTTPADLVGHPATAELFRHEVSRANSALQARGQPAIGAFRILPRALEPEAGDEITLRGEVKRQQLAAKFASLRAEARRDLGAEAPVGISGLPSAIA